MTRPPMGSSLDIPEVHALHDEIARLLGLVEEAQRERDEARKMYGAKFTAITAALGYATALDDALVNDDTEAAGEHSRNVMAILVDA